MPKRQRRCDTCEWWQRRESNVPEYFEPEGSCHFEVLAVEKMDEDWCRHWTEIERAVKRGVAPPLTTESLAEGQDMSKPGPVFVGDYTQPTTLRAARDLVDAVQAYLESYRLDNGFTTGCRRGDMRTACAELEEALK